MANNENLKPVRSEKEAREKGRAGGVASGEARREKRKLAELLKIALEQQAANGNTNAENITAAIIKQAEKGNARAFEIIRDTIGEKPAEEININNLEIEIKGDED